MNSGARSRPFSASFHGFDLDIHPCSNPIWDEVRQQMSIQPAGLSSHVVASWEWTIRADLPNPWKKPDAFAGRTSGIPTSAGHPTPPLPRITLRGSSLSIDHPAYVLHADLETRRARGSIAVHFTCFASLLRAFVSSTLPLHGGLLLHAAAFKRPSGRGLIFAGPSGSGKTTLAHHATRAFVDLQLLSDELVSVVCMDGRSFALFGSPDRQDGTPDGTALLEGVYLLHRARVNRRTILPPRVAAREILRNTVLKSHSGILFQGALDIACQLARAVKVEELVWDSPEGMLEPFDTPFEPLHRAP